MTHATRIRVWGMAFVSPTLALFVVFKYGPMVWALWLAFTTYDMVRAPTFVGFENFASLAADPAIPWSSAWTWPARAATPASPARRRGAPRWCAWASSARAGWRSG